MTYPRSDHYDGHRFHNPGGETPPSLRDIFKWQTFRFLRKAPKEPPALQETIQALGQMGSVGNAMFLGHSSFLLSGAGWNALVDPVFSEVIGPGFGLGYRRRDGARFSVGELVSPDFVLLTHNHYDHCDTRTLRDLAKLAPQPVAVAPLGNGKLLRRMGFRDVVELDWWESWRPSKGPEVTLTPAIHFSARGPFDRNRSLWGGFFLKDGELSFFAAGDTAYGKHFGEITARLGPPRLALLPIGAHEPARLMKPVHQGPKEAIRAHRDLGAHRSVAFHFGSFALADDTLHGPAQELAARREEAGLAPGDFVIPQVGQVVAVG